MNTLFICMYVYLVQPWGRFIADPDKMAFSFYNNKVFNPTFFSYKRIVLRDSSGIFLIDRYELL